MPKCRSYEAKLLHPSSYSRNDQIALQYEQALYDLQGDFRKIRWLVKSGDKKLIYFFSPSIQYFFNGCTDIYEQEVSFPLLKEDRTPIPCTYI